MTAVLDPAEHDVDHGHDDHGHSHPTDKTYWVVGLFLAVLTVLEIICAEVLDEAEGGARVLLSAGLLIMMVVKFGTVVAMFMHLRFDNKLLRNLFLIGLFLALGCYAAAAGAMSFWDGEKGGPEAVIIDPVKDQPLPPEPTLPAPIPHGEGGHG